MEAEEILLPASTDKSNIHICHMYEIIVITSAVPLSISIILFVYSNNIQQIILVAIGMLFLTFLMMIIAIILWVRKK